MGVVRRTIGAGLQVVAVALLVTATAAQGADRPVPQATRQEKAEAAAPVEKAFRELVQESIGLLAPASGRAGGEIDFALILGIDIDQPVAFFAEPKKAVIAAGLVRALPGVDAWLALLARLEATRESEPGLARHKRFTVKAVPPSDALYLGGTNDPNQQIVRRSTQTAMEALRRKRIPALTPEQWLERQQRIDAAAIEILRKMGLGADALLHLYRAVAAAGGVTLESADPAWREPMTRHLAWLEKHVGPARPLPQAVAALAPKLARVQAALAGDGPSAP
ncbi:MAG: hypothetical protein D6740_08850 [Alphaproteobacteria bacterium]|nr:MAG: hypothetical protein D6740_08850 [Alphaproteobacteria bacterium]